MNQTNRQRSPLYDQEAEQRLLSTMLLKEVTLKTAINQLSMNDFYFTVHGKLFQIIKNLSMQGHKPDLLLVKTALKNQQAPESEINTLINLATIPGATSHDYLINSILEYSRKREIIKHLQKTLNNATSPTFSAGQIIGEASLFLKEFSKLVTPYEGIINASDLLSMDFPETKYIISGLIPEGVTLLTSPPKIGKSWFVLDIMTSVSIGAEIMNIKTEPKKGLYLALEDNPRRLKNRIIRQNIGNLKNIKHCQLTTQWQAGSEGLLRLSNYIEAEKPDLIGIDTLAVFSKMKDGNDYQEAVNIFTNFKNITHETGTSIILVHHTRKQQASGSDTDFIERTMGSQGFAGGADSIISINKKRHSGDATLNITGRDVEEQELAIKFNPLNCRWELLGKVSEIVKSAERQEIIDLLKEEDGLTPIEIAEKLNKNRSTTRGLLGKLVESGHLIKQEISGRYKINDNEL